MSEQNVSAPQTSESLSSDAAISNLRGAIDSIGKMDLNTSSSIERTPTAPIDENLTDKKINYVDNSKTDSNEQKQESNDAESNDESVDVDNQDSQPQEEKAKIRWKELKQAEDSYVKVKNKIAQDNLDWIEPIALDLIQKYTNADMSTYKKS